MRKSAGFTLIELVVTVAIVGILAAIAVPAYTRYVTESHLPEAFNGLTTLGQNLESYFQDNNTYVGACQSGTNAPLPSTDNFTFSCPSLTASSWTVQANGKAGGPMAGFSFQLTSQGAQTTQAVPSGWNLNGSCWVRDPAGDCQ